MVVKKLRTCIHSLDDNFDNVLGGGRLYGVRVGSFNQLLGQDRREVSGFEKASEYNRTELFGTDYNWRNTFYPNDFNHPELIKFSEPNYFLSCSPSAKPPQPIDVKIVRRTKSAVFLAFDLPNAATNFTDAIRQYGIQQGLIVENETSSATLTTANLTNDTGLETIPYSYFMEKAQQNQHNTYLQSPSNDLHYDFQVPTLQYFANVSKRHFPKPVPEMIALNQSNCTINDTIFADYEFIDANGTLQCVYNSSLLANVTLPADSVVTNMTEVEPSNETNATFPVSPFRPICDYYTRCFFTVYDDSNLEMDIPIVENQFSQIMWNGGSRLAVLENLIPGQKYNISLTFSTDAGESDRTNYEFAAGFVPFMPEEVLRIECLDCTPSRNVSAEGGDVLSYNLTWSVFGEYDPRFMHFFPIL
ncbi:unnamed protein product, partial [Amoebophrya sp. A120]|eukprot:GSA120T00003995001.1